MQSNCSIFIQDADVAARNAAVSQVLSEPRISPLGQLSIAEWDEVKGGALVRKKTGKYWESFGHTEFGVSEETYNNLQLISMFNTRSCDFFHNEIFDQAATSMMLWPEEALFLVECNHLRLLLRGVPGCIITASICYM